MGTNIILYIGDIAGMSLTKKNLLKKEYLHLQEYYKLGCNCEWGSK